LTPSPGVAEFASLAAHELRSPLQVIQGFATLLDRLYGPQLDERGRDMVRWILSSATRQEVLISDMVAYAQTVAGGLQSHAVDLELVMPDVIGALDPELARGGGSVTWDPLPVVTGDREQLTRLLQNLVANAVKFVDPGTVPQVHLSAEPADDRWLLSVSDNGIGIDPNDRAEVFKMFTRLHPRGRFDGSGLGLTTCRQIVESAGGRIWADGAPGVGSVFRFTLPKGVSG
jgi:signal transduction histidine kinase